MAWGAWNAGAAGFHAVVLTFVFSVYLTGVVGRELPGPVRAQAWLGYAVAAAGLVVALAAPVVGLRADLLGRRKRTTLVWTAATLIAMTGLVAVGPQAHWLVPGLVLLGCGSVCAELASVTHNAMLGHVSTRRSLGRSSAVDWSMGYLGGVVLTLLVWGGLIADGGGLLRVPTVDAWNVRLVALVAAGWFAVLTLPLIVAVPEPRVVAGPVARPGLRETYRRVGRDLRALHRTDRSALLYLGASALYRDGLAAIAVFGGVLAVTAYGVRPADVLVYGIAANVAAAAGALAGGLLEDRVGPKTVVVGALFMILALGLLLLVLSGPTAFWIVGLAASAFLGPAHSSSRSFLAHLAAPGREARLFGLYAGSGRATSFLVPLLFGVCVQVTGAPRAGIAGILAVLLLGLLALLPVTTPGEAVPRTPARLTRAT